jgi:uncharacterized protein VirK/YbjX
MQFQSREKSVLTIARGAVSSKTALFQVFNNKSLDGWLRCLTYFWVRLRQTPLREIILFVLLFLRHLPSVLKLLMVRHRNSDVLIKARPEILEFIYSPYLAASWSVQNRVDRIIDHCRTVNRIGGIIDFMPDRVIDVLHLHPIDRQYRITLDQARWFLRDGQLVISLWHGVDRLYSISFCLSSQDDDLKAFIGGIQGRAGPDMLDRYRDFTKQSFGMRPSDFLIEVFKMFCRAINVTEIHAVSDENHQSTRSALNTSVATGPIKLSYDKIWIDRGGSYGGRGFFVLPVAECRRADEEIPAKKRAIYRKRYQMMALVDQQLTRALKGHYP